ncbi:alpha-1,3-mannosyl-glycoprotein 4-beta-N-acetylglucosaminyltransferase C-like [Montipora capricornis]|uniref:alpha-1,3-mannosyl-glycoprotein 4-beta-N-acetylglucosaminyltransferase C-like n=1 Tax=Montipora capricornis TaxID=246305 RepID=UPI0035F10FC5
MISPWIRRCVVVVVAAVSVLLLTLKVYSVIHMQSKNNNVITEAADGIIEQFEVQMGHREDALCPAVEIMESPKVVKLGQYPTTKRYLSIGIASVERPSGANYLLKTTQSLIDNMSDEDKHNTLIVIFLADIDGPPKSRAITEISNIFDKYINQGLLTVIEAPLEFYPPLTNIKPKYGDSDSRRKWRSKENVDASFVMCFCKDLSDYYIHLEDDVISSPSFVPKLQDFISGQNKKGWLILDVTVQGSKAKVYHNQDLANIASYFYLMYDEMPIDWLMGHWRGIKSGKMLTPPASLFQHIGDTSSLKEKGQSGRQQREPFFDHYDQKFRGLNPPATVTTSMSSHEGKAEDAYKKGSGLFWALHPQEKDFLLVTFQTPTVIQRVTVDTGSYYAKHDLLKYGVLQGSYQDDTLSEKNDLCRDFEDLGSFSGGKVDMSPKSSNKVACLKILVTQRQDTNVYFREINIW